MKNLILKVICVLCFIGLAGLSACVSSPAAKPTAAEPAKATAVVKEKAVAEPVAALPSASASIGKVMVLDFPLSDLTDLPNPPQELARIAHFNDGFKQKLADNGVQIVPVNDKIKAIAAAQSATYLFDHTDIAASLAESSGADYIIIGVAMKPTYLFVYPRMLLVDIKTKRKAFTAYVQMEGSWLDKEHTASSAKNLANKVTAELKQLNVPTK